jgi:hypothetical protein
MHSRFIHKQLYSTLSLIMLPWAHLVKMPVRNWSRTITLPWAGAPLALACLPRPHYHSLELKNKSSLVAFDFYYHYQSALPWLPSLFSTHLFLEIKIIILLIYFWPTWWNKWIIFMQCFLKEKPKCLLLFIIRKNTSFSLVNCQR